MFRLVFIHISTALGGSEKAFLDLLHRLPSDIRSEALVILPGAGPLAEECRKELRSDQVYEWVPPQSLISGTRKKPHWTLARFLFDSYELLTYLRKIRREISLIQKKESLERKSDERQLVWYVNGLKNHILSLPLILGSSSRLVWHIQDFFPSLWFVKIWLRIFSLFGAEPDLIICNSRAVLQDMMSSVPKSWRLRMNCVHNAVDVEFFLPSRPRNSDFRSSPFMISMVGMLTPWKGQTTFLEALHLLKKMPNCPSWKAQIVGDEVYQTDGEMGYRQLLEAKIKDLSLSSDVAILGLRKDVENIYNGSDILVHASIKPEPFGKVIVEAMACGCPVVAAGAGGVLEIIDDDMNGLLFPPGKSELLAEKLRVLLVDNELRSRIGIAARETAVNHFSAKTFAKEILKSVESILKP